MQGINELLNIFFRFDDGAEIIFDFASEGVNSTSTVLLQVMIMTEKYTTNNSIYGFSTSSSTSGYSTNTSTYGYITGNWCAINNTLD